MFTKKDIEYKSIFVVNCIENRSLKVLNGLLLLEDSDVNKTLTKLPFQKILALFVIGNITVTTPFIDKCNYYGIPIVVMKPSFRPVFFYSITAEANFLLRKRQYEFNHDDIKIAKVLVTNKIKNQLRLLLKTRQKNCLMINSISICENSLVRIGSLIDYDELMGIEGRVAKAFFSAYYEQTGWKTRSPRTKIDPLNATLDIGYTLLFNYIECFVRLFGFDPYVGVYHRLWFKRKSLICDLMEPFRCLIDQQVRKGFNSKQCRLDDFQINRNEFHLKKQKSKDYTKLFYDALIPYKNDLFKYIQQYYRCFMRQKGSLEYPFFLIE